MAPAKTADAPAPEAEAEKPKKAPSQTRQETMDALFKGKKYDIVKEVKLEGDKRFTTPFGNKGRHGFVLVPAGEKPTATNVMVVGASMLSKIAETYGAVTLPEKPARRKAAGEKKPALTPEERAALAAEANQDLLADL